MAAGPEATASLLPPAQGHMGGAHLARGLDPGVAAPAGLGSLTPPPPPRRSLVPFWLSLDLRGHLVCLPGLSHASASIPTPSPSNTVTEVQLRAWVMVSVLELSNAAGQALDHCLAPAPPLAAAGTPTPTELNVGSGKISYERLCC